MMKKGSIIGGSSRSSEYIVKGEVQNLDAFIMIILLIIFDVRIWELACTIRSRSVISLSKKLKPEVFPLSNTLQVPLLGPNNMTLSLDKTF